MVGYVDGWPLTGMILHQVGLVGHNPVMEKLKISDTIAPMFSGDVGLADLLVGLDCVCFYRCRSFFPCASLVRMSS